MFISCLVLRMQVSISLRLDGVICVAEKPSIRSKENVHVTLTLLNFACQLSVFIVIVSSYSAGIENNLKEIGQRIKK